MSKVNIVLLVAVVAALATVTPALRQSSDRIEANQKQSKSAHPEESPKNVSEGEPVSQNEISDRIHVGEPIKLMLQTTARFALAQTKLPNHMSIETAMDMLNDAGTILSRPSNLVKVVKIIGVSLATFLVTVLFFPSSYGIVEQLWSNPESAFNLDRHLSNGLSEKSVLGTISSRTDDALSRVGLSEPTCREKSLCYLGEIIKCTFPQTSEAITRFAADNLSNSGYRENRYFKSFSSGFVDQNCTKVNGEARDSSNCLGNLFNSVVLSRFSNELPQQHKQKYQSVPVGRA